MEKPRFSCSVMQRENLLCVIGSVFVFTQHSFKNMLELRQGITKQMEKALFPQCVRDSGASLRYRSCSQGAQNKVPQV